MTDVLALSTKIARQLDPIAPEHRATVLRLLAERYQLGLMAGAVRMRRHRSDALVTPQESLNGVTLSPAPPPTPVFQIPESIRTALSKSKILGAVQRLQTSEFWQAEVRANPGVDFGAEVLNAEAWIVANPDRAPRKNHTSFLHRWLGRAGRNA